MIFMTTAQCAGNGEMGKDLRRTSCGASLFVCGISFLQVFIKYFTAIVSLLWYNEQDDNEQCEIELALR